MFGTNNASALPNVRGRGLIILLLGLTALLGVSAVADTVHKRDGRSVSGTIVEETPEQVVVQTNFGPITIPRADILRIEKGATPLEQFRSRWEDVDRSDAVALMDLADWCRDNRLNRETRKVYRELIKVEPDNETAQRGLGNTLVDGEWVSKAELAKLARRKKEEERKARAAARKASRSGSGKGKSTSDPLADLGDLSAEVAPFLAPLSTNQDSDAKVAQELEDFFGQRFSVGTSERFSLRAQMKPSEVHHHLELAESLFVRCNKLFGLEPDHRLWKDQYLMFHVKQKGTYIDLVDWIDKEITDLDPEIKKMFKDGGALIDENPKPISAAVERDTPLEQAIAHWVGQMWLRWYTRNGVRPWLVEGFAAYTSVNQFGVNSIYCTTNTKYANKVEVADKNSDAAYQLVCFDIIENRIDDGVPHEYSELITKGLNRLDFADLAKSWSIVDFLMKEHRDEFRTYVQSVGKYKDEEECLKKVFGWSGADLDKHWEEYVRANYDPSPAAQGK